MKEQNDILQEGLDRIMRDVFEKSLNDLHQMMLEMGQDCQCIIANTYKALIKNDLEVVDNIRSYENKINHLERNIENKCMQLLLLQAPIATDLRKVSSALKMITDLERIGDHAYDIADIIKKNQNVPSYVGELPFKVMAKTVMQMVDDCMRAFVNNDKDLAYAVIKEDDAVDQCFDEIYNHLADGIGAKNHADLDLLMIAKYYERIGDHAVNIAEWVVYAITNEHMGIGEK